MEGALETPKGLGRDFRLLVAVRFLGSFSVQLQAVILGWQMYELTRDPLHLGLIGLVEAVPAIGLALFAGWFVDRSNPKRVISAVVFVSLLSMAIAWAARDPLHLFLAAFLTGLARSFYSPSFQSLTPRLVAKKDIHRGVAASNSAMKLAYVTGPAAAGLLLGWKGAGTAYAIGSAFFTLAIGCALALRYDHSRFRSAPKADRKFLDELTAGLRFVFSNRLLLAALSLDMFAVLFGGVTAILPMISEEILHAGPRGLGFLRASPAIGALAMSLWLVRRPPNRGAGRLLLKVVAGFGICTIAFAVSRNVVLSCALLALAGALDGVSLVIRGSIVQLASPEHMRGRIASVNSIFIGSSNEIGAFESGLAAKFLGLVPSVAFGGVMTLLTVAWVARKVPELKTLDLDRLRA
jgi:MFS family permease